MKQTNVRVSEMLLRLPGICDLLELDHRSMFVVIPLVDRSNLNSFPLYKTHLFFSLSFAWLGPRC